MEARIKGQNISIENPVYFFFDKDGTLIDAHNYWIKMTRLRVRLVLKALNSEDNFLKEQLENNLGVDLRKNEMKKDGPTGVKPRHFNMEVVLDTVKSMGLEISLAEIETIFDTTDEISSKSISDYLKTLPQAENLIKQLFNKGIKLALISNDISKRTSLAMEALGLSNFFQHIIGQDKVKEGKPSGELSDYIISKEQIPLDKIVNIGDHPNDILMGLNSGIKNNIGVLTGLSRAEDFKDSNCILINDLTEIEVIG